MTERETERYQRNLLVEGFSATGQQRLSESRVTVVGAGGLGSATLNYLAAAGVGRLRIVENDTVSLSNLQRQILYTTADLDAPKAEVAAARLSRLQSGLPDRNPHRPARRRQCGRQSCRIATSSWTAPTTTPPVMRSTISVRPGGYRWYTVLPSRSAEQVSVFNTAGAGSYRSLYPEQPVQQPIVGVLSPIVGVIGSLQALETIKLLAGIGDGLAGRLLTIDGRTMRIFTFEI